MQILHLASAIITNPQNEFLIVRKNNSSYFQMVGGKIDVEEQPIETLIRECQEEIQIDISSSPIELLGEHSTKAVNEQETLVEAQIFHVALPENTFVQCASEIAEFAWMSKTSYQNYQLAHLLREFSLPWWLAYQN